MNKVVVQQRIAAAEAEMKEEVKKQKKDKEPNENIMHERIELS